MSWYVFSLLSVVALAAAELTQQFLLNRSDPINERTSAVLTFLVQSMLTIPILILSPLRNQIITVFSPGILPRLVAVTLIGAIGMAVYLRSFKVQNISLSVVFGSASVIVSTTLGIIFFRESFQPAKLIGIFLILSAILSLNYKNIILEKNHIFGVLSGMLFGVCYTLDKSIVLHISPVVYMFWTGILVGFFGFVFSPRTVIKSMKGKGIKEYTPVFVSGIFYFIYNLSVFTAYTFGGEVGKVDAINNTQVFLIIIFEYFILSHKLSIRRKLLAAIIAYVGVLMLGIF